MSGDRRRAAQRFTVQHRTEYRYGRPMSDGYTVAHLLPRDTTWQRVESAEVIVEPPADLHAELVDAFGNRVVHLGVHHPHDHLVVTSRSVVEVTVPDDDWLRAAAVPWDSVAAAVRVARGDLAAEVGPFTASTAATPPIDGLASLGAEVFRPGRTVLEVVRDLTHAIFTQFEFDPEFSDVSTPLDEVLRARRGVCQDFAHLMLACLRHHGMAARYVSGYIETDPPPGQPKLAGTDASHAWCSVWAPGIGWFDADPTNDQVPPRRHVTTAWGRDYVDIAPVRGVVIGPASTQQMHVGVDVTALS